MIRILKNIKPKHKNVFIFFIGRFIKRGNKNFILKNFMKVFINLKKLKKKNLSFFYNFLLDSIKPVLFLKPWFAGGKIYMLPTYINAHKEKTLALKWFYKAVNLSIDLPFFQRLLRETSLCFQNKGKAIQFKKDLYEVIKLNRDLLYRFKKKRR